MCKRRVRVGASYDDLTRGHYAHTLHGLMCCTEVRMIGPIDLLVVQAGAPIVGGKVVYEKK